MSDPNAPLPPTGFVPAATSSTDDALAWVSIATGALSWLVCCCAPIPLLGLLSAIAGLILAITSTICGGFALRSASREGRRTDLAIIGLVLGGGRLVVTFGLLGLAVVLVMLGVGAGLLGEFQHLAH